MCTATWAVFLASVHFARRSATGSWPDEQFFQLSTVARTQQIKSIYFPSALIETESSNAFAYLYRGRKL